MIFIIIILLILMLIIDNPKKDNYIKILLRQTARWSVAAEQDESPMIAVLHANYAVGYLQALTDIATEKEINKYIDFDSFKKKVYNIQDGAVKKVVKVCPNYIGNINKELALIGINIFNNNENPGI
jgi:hypothetical protein